MNGRTTGEPPVLLDKLDLICYGMISLDPRSRIWTYRSRVVKMQFNEYIKEAKWHANISTGV